MNTTENNTTTVDTTTSKNVNTRPTHAALRLTPGNYPGQVVSAKWNQYPKSAEDNARYPGKKYGAEITIDFGVATMSKILWFTTPEAQANTRKVFSEVWNLEGADIFKGIASTVNTQVRVNVGPEEYNGRVTNRIRFINPLRSEEITEADMAELMGMELPEELQEEEKPLF
jgi:hypothetical protein